MLHQCDQLIQFGKGRLPSACCTGIPGIANKAIMVAVLIHKGAYDQCHIAPLTAPAPPVCHLFIANLISVALTNR